MFRESLLCLAWTLTLSSAQSKVCNAQDATFSACMEEEANEYFASLEEEHDSTFRPVNVTIRNGPMNLQVHYDVTKYFNLTNGIKMTMKYDLPSKTVSGTIEAPHVGHYCNFDAVGKLAGITIQGKGLAALHMYDMVAAYTSKVKLIGNKLQLDGLDFKIKKIKNAKVEILELTSPTKQLENVFRLVTASQPDLIFNLSKEQWEYNIKSHYGHLTNEFLSKMLRDGVIKVA